MYPANTIEGILSKITKTKSCWLWNLKPAPDGYGRVRFNNKQWQAHRLVYELLKGPVPGDLVLDHLCRNRICVNPDHLEPVTLKVNILRGIGRAAINARKQVCLKGHPFTSGKKFCLICYKEWKKEWQKNNRDKVKGYKKTWELKNPEMVRARRKREWQRIKAKREGQIQNGL